MFRLSGGRTEFFLARKSATGVTGSRLPGLSTTIPGGKGAADAEVAGNFDRPRDGADGR